MKGKKDLLLTIVFIVLIMVLPVPSTFKDGGTKTYSALTYKIVKWNRLVASDETNNKFIENGCYHKTSVYLFPENFKSIDSLYSIEYDSFEYKHDPNAPDKFVWKEGSEINAKGYTDLMTRIFEIQNGVSEALQKVIDEYNASLLLKSDAVYTLSEGISDGNRDQALVYVWKNYNNIAEIECAAYFGHKDGKIVGPIILKNIDEYIFYSFASRGIGIGVDKDNKLVFYDFLEDRCYSKDESIESTVGFGRNTMVYYSSNDGETQLHVANFEKAASNPSSEPIEELFTIPISREHIRIRHDAIFNSGDRYLAVLYTENTNSRIRTLRVFDTISGTEVSEPLSLEHPEYSVKDYIWAKAGGVLCELLDNNGYYWFEIEH